MAADGTYNTQNYQEQGGARWTIGATGELKIVAGGKITNDGTQAAALPALVDQTGGVVTSAGTLTAAAVQTGTLTAAHVAILNANFANLGASVDALRAAVHGVGITA